MKFFAILSLAAVISSMPASASCKSFKAKLLPWDEESCVSPTKPRDRTTLEEGSCHDFDVFRSYQISPYKHLDKIGTGCIVEIFDSKGCRGRKTTAPSLMDETNRCNNATFELSHAAAKHSGRSARLVCEKGSSSSSATLPKSTLITVPYVETTLVKTETSLLISSLSPSTVKVTSIIIPEPSTVTVTSVRSYKPVINLVSPSSRLTRTSVVLVTPSPTTSTKVIWIQPSSSSSKPTTTKTLCFTTAFMNKAQPTKRAAIEEASSGC